MGVTWLAAHLNTTCSCNPFALCQAIKLTAWGLSEEACRASLQETRTLGELKKGFDRLHQAGSRAKNEKSELANALVRLQDSQLKRAGLSRTTLVEATKQ